MGNIIIQELRHNFHLYLRKAIQQSLELRKVFDFYMKIENARLAVRFTRYKDKNSLQKSFGPSIKTEIRPNKSESGKPESLSDSFAILAIAILVVKLLSVSARLSVAIFHSAFKQQITYFIGSYIRHGCLFYIKLCFYLETVL